MGLFNFLTKTIGIDPGSQNLRIVHDGKVIFNEASELSVDSVTQKVSGYGNESIQTESNILLKPVNTVIADFHGFEHLLRGAIKNVFKESTWLTPGYRMYFSLPISATEVDKRAYRDSGEHAGAKEVYMIHQACSAAIGMGILFKKKDFVLVDFGASKIEITLFAKSIPIAEGAIRIGTWKLKQALKNYISRIHQITLTTDELEYLLKNIPNIGEVYEIENKQIRIEELRNILNSFFVVMEDQILQILDQGNTNSSSSRIFSNGIYFTGGGSLLNWIPEKITLNTKINSSISSDPLMDNINGIKMVMQDPEKFKEYLFV